MYSSSVAKWNMAGCDFQLPRKSDLRKRVSLSNNLMAIIAPSSIRSSHVPGLPFRNTLDHSVSAIRATQSKQYIALQCSFVSVLSGARYQIGEDHPRCWRVAGTCFGNGRPFWIARRVDQRGVGISRTRK